MIRIQNVLAIIMVFVFASLLFVACSNQQASLEPSVDMEEFTQGLYRSGSLIYDGDDSSVSHLYEGMDLPFRLCKLVKKFDLEKHKPGSIRANNIYKQITKLNLYK